MKSNHSKSERKEERIQQLEKELASAKKKLASQTKTVHIDQEQIDNFMDALTERIEWSTNRIVDELELTEPQSPEAENTKTGLDLLIKLMICIPFFVVGLALLFGMYHSFADLWSQGWYVRIFTILIGIIGVDCLFLGCEVLHENDRNYLLSLFSALVALVALIITLIK